MKKCHAGEEQVVIDPARREEVRQRLLALADEPVPGSGEPVEF